MTLEKKRVVNGYVVSDGVFQEAVKVAEQQIQGLLFNSFKDVLITGVYMAYVGHTSETIIKGIIYFVILCLMFAACHSTKVLWKRGGFSSVKTNPMIWLLFAVVFGWLLKHEVDIDSLWKEVKQIRVDLDRVDEGVNEITKTLNQGFNYTVTKYDWAKEMDEWVGNKLHNAFEVVAKHPPTREQFGLGCFVEGTLIQVNAEGTVFARVEDLRDGDWVWNGITEEKTQIHSWIWGPENDGYLYVVTTSDGFSVTVTETHPMLLCDIDSDVIDCDNVAVKNMKGGDLNTLTVNGYARVESIEKVAANGTLVYNFMFDASLDLNERGIVANGVVTLDLKAQSAHH